MAILTCYATYKTDDMLISDNALNICVINTFLLSIMYAKVNTHLLFRMSQNGVLCHNSH